MNIQYSFVPLYTTMNFNSLLIGVVVTKSTYLLMNEWK